MQDSYMVKADLGMVMYVYIYTVCMYVMHDSELDLEWFIMINLALSCLDKTK